MFASAKEEARSDLLETARWFQGRSAWVYAEIQKCGEQAVIPLQYSHATFAMIARDALFELLESEKWPQ